jgi:DNA-binding NarL/FixJ family response regulator
MEKLTLREREISTLVAQALSNKEIARKLGLTEGTVKVHLHNIFDKLGLQNRTQLATACQNVRPQ